MPKRSLEEKIKILSNKIRKLQDEKNKRHKPKRSRLRIITSSSESDEEVSEDPICDVDALSNNSNEVLSMQENVILEQPIIERPISPELNVTPETAPEEAPRDGQESSTSRDVAPDEVTVDPELLLALGESTSDEAEYGEAIHENLAKLWLPVLRKGLSKENKEKLMKQYLIPDNCTLLQSPKLNPEITAAVSEIVRGRDKKLSVFQQQLGAGITAMNRGMEVLLNGEDKAQALKYLSDACRITTDLHFSWTKDRIKLITPSLEKNFFNVIQDAKRDDTLFGNSLSEKIKASKAITRQGLQIKKTMPHTRVTTAAPHAIATRFNPQGNWRGPPRFQFQSNRGGRGGYKRTAPAQRTYSATTASPRPAGQYKPRAPTLQ